MTQSNVRLSNSGNIVTNHNYFETHCGAKSRKVSKTKVVAKPNEDGTFRFVSTSEQGRKLAIQFALENNLVIN